MRTRLSLLIFTLGSAGDVRLVQVSEGSSPQWTWAGQIIQEDQTSSVAEMLPDIDGSISEMERLFELRCSSVFSGVDRQLGRRGLGAHRRPCPDLKPSTGRKKLPRPTSGTSSPLCLALPRGRKEKQDGQSNTYLEGRLKFAHVYHATRGSAQIRDLRP